MKFVLKDKNLDFCFQNIPKECSACVLSCNSESERVSCQIDSKIKRRGRRESKSRSVYLCSSRTDDLNSSKVFKSYFEIYFQVLQNFPNLKEQLIEPVSKSSKRLMHNIVSHNTKNLQEFEYYFPQFNEIKKYSEQTSFLKEHLKKLIHNNDFLDAFLSVFKREKLIKLEIDTHNKVLGSSMKFDNNKSTHKLQKVFLSSFFLYSKEFEDFGIEVSIEESGLEAFFDYHSISVALSHLLDNCVKYSLENSRFLVKFFLVDDYAVISIDMVSLRIEEFELESIFEEGISGVHATKSRLNGDGVGMWMIKAVLTMNKGKILIKRDHVKSLKITNSDGQVFENNIFEIYLPIPRKR